MSAEASSTVDIPKRALEEEVELARRAFALGQYEQAVDHYASALELQTEKHGDRAPENADLYLAYGKALLEHAITQSSVLGKQGANADDTDSDDDADEGKGSLASAFFSFSSDAEVPNVDADGDAPPDSDAPVDLFAEAEKAVADADAAGAADEDEDEDGEDGEEPEDDFNAAWEILDLARALFELQSESDELAKLKLADTYVALGDVSLETEKFDQAISDYEAGLALKTALLPTSSRQLAEVHYKLALVLDMSPGRLKDAIAHVDNALASTKARLDELRVALANGPPAEVPAPAPAPAAASDTKGKGKVAAPVLDKNTVASLSKAQVEAEIKEMEGLSGDLQLKLEELSQPTDEDAVVDDTQLSAPALAARALDRELSAGTSSGVPTVPGQTGLVNDLTGMVKKKKKPVDVGAAGTKRKADDDDAPSPTEKRARVEEVLDADA